MRYSTTIVLALLASVGPAVCAPLDSHTVSSDDPSYESTTTAAQVDDGVGTLLPREPLVQSVELLSRRSGWRPGQGMPVPDTSGSGVTSSGAEYDRYPGGFMLPYHPGNPAAMPMPQTAASGFPYGGMPHAAPYSATGAPPEWQPANTIQSAAQKPGKLKRLMNKLGLSKTVEMPRPKITAGEVNYEFRPDPADPGQPAKSEEPQRPGKETKKPDLNEEFSTDLTPKKPRARCGGGTQNTKLEHPPKGDEPQFSHTPESIDIHVPMDREKCDSSRCRQERMMNVAFRMI
ncbi:hypothetical protein BC835DRAFT_1311432 [Cytidiella melzeri]|nr:hypothetical protein BC835DRAFT_1311432 [Cytidiella melzeri]